MGCAPHRYSCFCPSPKRRCIAKPKQVRSVSPMPIHSGMVIIHHRQLITPSSRNTRKTTNIFNIPLSPTNADTSLSLRPLVSARVIPANIQCEMSAQKGAVTAHQLQLITAVRRNIINTKPTIPLQTIDPITFLSFKKFLPDIRYYLLNILHTFAIYASTIIDSGSCVNSLFLFPKKVKETL